MCLNSFKSKIFPLQTSEGTSLAVCIAKLIDHSHLKILIPKQMLQR